jgi:hypothetical protein
VGKTNDKESSGVFETVLDWVINDDHYEGVTHETGSRYEHGNHHETSPKDKDSDNGGKKR